MLKYEHYFKKYKFDFKIRCNCLRVLDVMFLFLKVLSQSACKQLDKVLNFLSNNWEDFRAELDSELAWKSVIVHRIILSSTFEADRSSKFLDKGLWKISMFELERYLQNDAALMFNVDSDQPIPTLQDGFYPKGEQLSGQRLWELIEEGILWKFLGVEESN